jgi:signal transduction histidine kinase
MNATCFFEISSLLFLWITTVTAFLIFIWRLKRKENAGKNRDSSDILLGLFSQKVREAKVAAERLSIIADELGIGLIERTRSRDLIANRWAREFFSVGSEDIARFDDLIMRNDFPLILRPDNRVVEVRRLEAGDRQIFLLQDVTEGFRLAKELKQKERLALLGQMSAQVAHQIKTPLSVLAGRAQMLARNLIPGSMERKQAEEFYQESRDLAGQVTQVVNFYKDMEPEFSRIGVEEVLEKTAGRLRAIAGNCRIFLEAPDDMITITDSRLLSEALFLVAQNSLSPDNHSTLLELRAGQENDIVTITIRDDRRRIEEGSLERIFEPFYTTREEGLGLGLFMARDILSRISGRIRAEIPRDGGALFEIVIPAVHRRAEG